jgi:hypothetical protein
MATPISFNKEFDLSLAKCTSIKVLHEVRDFNMAAKNIDHPG